MLVAGVEITLTFEVHGLFDEKFTLINDHPDIFEFCETWWHGQLQNVTTGEHVGSQPPKLYVQELNPGCDDFRHATDRYPTPVRYIEIQQANPQSNECDEQLIHRRVLPFNPRSLRWRLPPIFNWLIPVC